MADWTDPPYSGLVAGKAWTDEKASAAFENVVALAEDAMGAPKIKRRAFSGTGTTVTFTGLGDYGGFDFSASARNVGVASVIALEYSTDGGSSWSVPDTLAVVKESGGVTMINGAFDFATGTIVLEGFAFGAPGDAVVHLSSTIASASLSIDAVRFSGTTMAVIIRPNGGTV